MGQLTFRAALFVFVPLLSVSAAHASPSPAGEGELTLWEMLQSTEEILIPLSILSFLVIAVIIFNFFWIRRGMVCSQAFEDEANRYLKNQDLEGLLEFSKRSKEAVAVVLTKVIGFAKGNTSVDLASLKELAETEANQGVRRLVMPNNLLSDLGVLAPLVGLFGTVIGLLRSFGSLASEAASQETLMLAGGVSQALVATAMGLAIGLTAMLFYSIFRARVALLTSHFETTVTSLIVKTSICLGTPKKSNNKEASTPVTPIKARAKEEATGKTDEDDDS